MRHTTLIFVAFFAFSGIFVAFACSKHNPQIKNEVRRIVLTNNSQTLNGTLGDYSRKVYFIGDVELGSKLENELIFSDTIKIENNNDFIETYYYIFEIPQENHYRKTIHYVKILNDKSEAAVVCPTPYTLNQTVSEANIRVLPNTHVMLRVTISAM